MGIEGPNDLGMGDGGGGGFNLNLLAQILMKGGAGMASAPQGYALGGLAKGISDVGTQQMASQNYMKMLQKMLSGMPQGGKLAMNSTSPVGDSTGNLNFSMPMNSGSQSPEAPAAPSSPSTGGSGGQSKIDNSLIGGTRSLLNPSSSPLGNISNADLVGLTPENISQAFGTVQSEKKFGLEEEHLKHKSMSELIQMLHTNAEIENIASQIKHRESDPKGTSEIQNYEYAKKQGYKGSFEEFKNITESASIKDYQYAKSQGYEGTYEKWQLDMKHAGANVINIGEKEREIEKFQGQKYFAGEKWTDDVEKHLGHKDTKATIDEATLSSLPASVKGQKKTKEQTDAEYNAARAKATAAETIRFIKSKITGAGGEVQKYRLGSDKKTIIWTVKWPSGDVKEVRYTFR